MSKQQAVQEILAQGGERFMDHLELLAAMSQDFVETGDIQEILSKALKRITDYMDAEGGGIVFARGRGQNFAMLSQHGTGFTRRTIIAIR
jgi:uncharacterized protein (UPF0332 family)